MRRLLRGSFYVLFALLGVVSIVGIVGVIVDMAERKYPLVNVLPLISMSLFLCWTICMILWFSKRSKKILLFAISCLTIGLLVIAVSMNETVHQFTLGLHKEYQRASTTLVSGNNAFEDLRAEPPHKTSQGSEAESTRTTLYQKDVYFDTDNFVMFLINEDNGTTKASAVVSFDGNDPSREAALLSTLSMFFWHNDYTDFLIMLVSGENNGMLVFSNGKNVGSPMPFPDVHRELLGDESLFLKYKEDCIYLLDSLIDYNGMASFKEFFLLLTEQLEWINRMPTDTPVHDDEYVQLSYVGLEKDSLGRHVLAFKVVNKTNVTLTFQADTFALDGVSLGTITGSNNVAAQSTGTVRFTPREQIPSVAPSLLTGAIRVIDFSNTLSGKQSYVVNFVNTAITYD